jgi:hypothetical protein
MVRHPAVSPDVDVPTVGVSLLLPLLAVMRVMVSAICRLMESRHALPRERSRCAGRGDAAGPDDETAASLVLGRSGFVDGRICDDAGRVDGDEC